ncbi:MAG: hypothetical protein ACRCVI_00890 [Mycoplasmoidaceae bacterium]
MKLFNLKKKDSTITEEEKTASETKIINLNNIDISETEEDLKKYCNTLSIDEIKYKLKNEKLDKNLKSVMEKSLEERK